MADLTLTVNDTHIPRIQAAFGEMLGLEGDATAEDIRQYLIAYMKDVTINYEQRQLVPSSLDIT